MNRAKLKTYAPQARRDFIQAMTDRAAFYGLAAKKIEPIVERGDVAVIAGREHPRTVAGKRQKLEVRVNEHGFEQTMEAMAYTWFNRFVAIRFMELHGYLDHGYRVLSHPEGKLTPEILEHAEHVELPGLKKDKVIDLKLAGNKESELYRQLLTAQCNALSTAMPFLFERIDDETELLLPDNLLHSDSLIRKLVSEIEEEDWKEVEIIGWLYQFYISEKKAEVIGKVVASEDIPAATQLFTPNWIVKYLVQNTLGRQWMATYRQSALRQQMPYYIEAAEQTPEVQEQLRGITPTTLNPEELTLLDPACGSGHILTEAYDLLKAIYQERGYRAKDIPALILQKNLFGLEIDDRAAQLASFALMMKARADDRRIFDSEAKPNILAFQESRGLDAGHITNVLNSPIHKDDAPRKYLFEEIEETETPLLSKKALAERGHVSLDDINSLLALFGNAKTFGSLIQIPPALAAKLPEIERRLSEVMKHGDLMHTSAHVIKPLLQQARLLAMKYDAVVANPPYMGSKGMNPLLKEFTQSRFPDSKSDLFAVFIERNLHLAKDSALVAMITMHSWMFISSYERLRGKLLDHETILSMAHLGARGFDSISGDVVSTTAFVLHNAHMPAFKGSFLRLVDGGSETEKENAFRQAIVCPDCGWLFHASASDFEKIPGSPIAYWMNDRVRRVFESGSPIGRVAAPRKGNTTTDNARFLRFWPEVSIAKVGFDFASVESFISANKKWCPYNKGGGYRKWYGYNEYLVNWEGGGREIKTIPHSVIANEAYFFKPGLTWSTVASGSFSIRYFGNGYVFDNGGCCVFGDSTILDQLAGFMNSKVFVKLFSEINPTLNFQSGDVARVPFIAVDDRFYALEISKISKRDWDSYETSWGFQQSPLLRSDHHKLTLTQTYAAVRAYWHAQTMEMQRLESANNQLFIDAYGLADDLKRDVPLREITLISNPHFRYGGELSDDEREDRLRGDTIRELLSYAIGCMMGRYSLDRLGLIYAHSGNEGFDANHYKRACRKRWRWPQSALEPTDFQALLTI